MQKPTRRRGLLGLAVAISMATFGVLGVSGAAVADPLTLAPSTGSGPTISVVNIDLSPSLNQDGSANTTPQVGMILLADPGVWNDMPGTKFTYQWQTISSTNVVANISKNGKAKDYVPVVANIGYRISVVVSATNSNGDLPGSATSEMTVTAVVGLNPATLTNPPGASANQTVANGGTPASSTQAFFTMYGYPDNTPPSNGISYAASSNTTFPNNVISKGIHKTAAGTGTYSDPITFATSNTELTPGTEIYVPRFEKYFIMEDSCQECGQDMSGQSPNNSDGTIGAGPNGGPGLIHFDLWIDGSQGDWPDAVLCENALTHYNSDGTPTLEPMIINPSNDLFVNMVPIFDPATSKCNLQPDGSSTSLEASKTVGQYQNVPGPDGGTGSPNGTGNCITDPGNGAVVGTTLTLAPCDGSASQNLSFAGALMIFNNLCLDMGTGSGARTVKLQLCNMNASQQWNINPNGTITDIQSGNYVLADQGGGTLTATKDGTSPKNYNYWNFPFAAEDNAAIPVTLSVSNILAGSTIEVSGTGLTTPTAEVRLVSAIDPVGLLLTTVTAAADGTFDVVVQIPKSLSKGNYAIAVNGSSAVIPPGTTLTVTDLKYGTLANFKPVNRTVRIDGVSSAVAVSAVSLSVTVSDSTVEAGSTVDVQAIGVGKQSANVWLVSSKGRVFLGDGEADSDGTYRGTVTIPVTTPAGGYRILVTGSDVKISGTVPIAVTEPSLNVSRASGSDRYGTSIEVSKRSFPDGAPVVFLVSGANFPDALSAAPAAALHGGPVLLTASDKLPAAVASELARLDPSRVVVVGRTGAVSASVVASVSTLLPHATVVREGGADRYATSLEVVKAEFSSSSKVYIASGATFPDALAAGPAAGSIGAPVLLVPGDASHVDAAIIAELHALGVTDVYVVGGTGAVSKGIASSLGAEWTVKRLAGADRFETAAAINEFAFSSASTVFLVTGVNYPDALSASPWAAASHSPMYLTPATCVPSRVIADARKLGATQVVLIGGTGVLTDAVADLIQCDY